MSIKRVISALLLVLCIATYTVGATSSNMCGTSATYSIVDNVLTINGEGIVDDDEGWIEYYNSIDALIVSEGITQLGSRLFDGFEILSSVSLPNSLTTIGIRTFRDCVSLEKIVIPDSVTSINANSFDGCDNLVIYCSSGSYAEQYAINNSITYKILSNITITFNANGGTNAPENITGSITEDFIIPKQKPTKPGYVFAGWATTASANIATYNVGDKINTTEDITLYALWLQCNITDESTENKLIIESNIASPELKLWVAAYKEKKMVALKSKDIQLIPGHNEIETEVEWDNVDRDEVKVFLWNSNIMPYTDAKNVALSKPCTITFVDWDGTVIDTQTVLSGSDAVLPASPTRTGYNFVGWSGNYKSVSSDATIIAQYIDTTKNNVFKVFSTQATKGENIKVTLYLGGVVETCGFDMRLNYDNTVLEFVNIDADWNLDIIANHVADESLIKFNYGATKNRTKSAKIMEVEFKIKDTTADSTTLSLTPISIIKADATQDNIPVATEYTLDNGVVTIK